MKNNIILLIIYKLRIFSLLSVIEVYIVSWYFEYLGKNTTSRFLIERESRAFWIEIGIAIVVAIQLLNVRELSLETRLLVGISYVASRIRSVLYVFVWLDIDKFLAFSKTLDSSAQAMICTIRIIVNRRNRNFGKDIAKDVQQLAIST